MDVDGGNGYKLPHMRKQQHQLAEHRFVTFIATKLPTTAL